MSLENAPFVLAPLLIQTAISYTLSKTHEKAPQIAFTATLALVDVPIILGVVSLGIVGSEHRPFVEMWIICALIPQWLFYNKVECGDPLTPVHYVTAFFIFMTEFTFTLGGWFGHYILVIAACFLVVKTLAITALIIYPEWNARVWRVIVISENLFMSLVTIVSIWSTTFTWLVPVALVAIPYAFPLSNANLSSMDIQNGWVSLVPTVDVTKRNDDE